jgi:hypothetical protein
MEKSKLFQYAIIWNPSKDQIKNGAVPMILVEPKTVLAKDDRSVLIMASREIPADKLNELDQIDIPVRPF